jgi:hypothetical protein
MSRFQSHVDQESIERSSVDGDDKSRTQQPDPFGDYERPFPFVGGVPANGNRVGAPFADPTVYDEQTFRIPEGMPRNQMCKVLKVRDCMLTQLERKLGKLSTAGNYLEIYPQFSITLHLGLIANSMIGTGIFSMPSTILKTISSPAAILLLWCVGGLLAYCG